MKEQALTIADDDTYKLAKQIKNMFPTPMNNIVHFNILEER